MAKVNIDLEKLVCALMKRYYLIHNIDRNQVKCWLDDVLEDCGIEYKDGSIHYIGEEEKKPATIKFEEEPVFDGMVYEYIKSKEEAGITGKELTAYRQGLEDMWNKLKSK